MLRNESENQKKRIAGEITRLSRDTIIMQMRFMDTALSQILPINREGIKGMGMDMKHIFYDSSFVLRRYKQETSYITRIYLHGLLHMVFHHPFGYKHLDKRYWDLATDIAVENVILEMNLPAFRLQKDAEIKYRLEQLKEKSPLTAEKLYKSIQKGLLSEEELEELEILLQRDVHDFWEEPENYEVSMAQWKKISERIRTDLKTFSKGKTESEALSKNLEEVHRDRYHYRDILQRFTVMGEEIKPSEDEFDYVYYTYGLNHYGNMPLIEPLEYKDTKKIKEFVIVIDTSASCNGSLVKAFLQKTYSILKETESFFTKMNVHIIQCDNEVQQDVQIQTQEDLEEFIKHGKLSGFGATDFRPAFEYVYKLQEEGQFENLKGLIYFTDGYGIYPEKMPEYDVIFAFLKEDELRPPVPTWAIKIILEDELDEVE